MHGDIKPSNVGFTSDGSPKLLDFGLARETGDVATRGGTVRYLSPEVLSGRPADEADDVWSLWRDAARNRIGRASVRGERGRRGRRSHSASASRPGRRGGGGSGRLVGLARVHGVRADRPRSARPSTARAFAAALHGVRRRQ